MLTNRLKIFRPTLLHLGGAATLAAVLVFATTYVGTANPQRTASAQFGSWGYNAFTDPDGSTVATVDFSARTEADLRRYVDTNRQLAKQLAAEGQKTLAVTATLSRPLPLDEFKGWAAVSPLRIKTFQIRVTGPDGRRATVGGAPVGGELVSAERLQGALDRVATHGASQVVGVIVVEGEVDSSAYERLANDSAVFLADVTRTAVASHIAKTAPGIDRGRLGVTVAPVYWTLEDLGLVKAR